MSDELRGKVCVITGGNRGIGRAAAEGLARMGGEVVLACRDAKKGEAARDEIRSATGNDAVHVMPVDLASQKSIRAFADALRERFPALHVLVNNAGVIESKRTLTEDGIETTFAVNHLAYFLLTNLLLKHLEAGAPARIINVSSAAHKRLGDFEDPQSEKSYDPLDAYSKSKLANILFTSQLAQRLGGTGITVNCLHPGTVGTGLLDQFFGSRLLLKPAKLFLKPWIIGPEQGAKTILYLATSPAVAEVSGKYFVNEQQATSSKVSYDEIKGNQLWEQSLELTARSK